MVGASARYSCLHAPVETVTPPRRQTKPIPFRFRGFRKSPESSISIGSVFLSDPKRRGFGSVGETKDDVRLPLELEPASLGFKFVKNVGSLRLPFQLEPAALGFKLVENER